MLGLHGGMAHVRRTAAIALSVLALALVLPVTTRPASAAPTPLRPSVFDGDWPDPHLVFDEASRRYYSYSTNFGVFGLEFNVPTRSSRDLVNWDNFRGDALPTMPAWASSGKTWSPGVARIGSHWMLYFTATEAGSGRQCIGVARSSSPEGPFTALGSAPLVCQHTLGGSIDASPFQDPVTGRWYLHWKSDGNAPGGDGNPRLFARELTSGGAAFTGTATVLTTDIRPDVNRLVENPDMIFDDGRYWLTFSMNDWDSADYAAHLAQCDGPRGPCTWVQPIDDPWLQADGDTPGTGGAAFVRDRDGRAVVSFHGWREAVGYDEGGRRALFLERITFDGPGRSPRIRTDISRVPTGKPTPIVANGRFVAQAHRVFLGREVRVAEQYSWVQRVLGGLSRNDFNRRLATSDEWLGHEIDELYQAALGRPADATGRAYWRQRVIEGMRLAEVGAYFYGSPEYFTRNGGTNEGFVTGLYRDILHRNPDDSGRRYWVVLLAFGMDPVAVAEEFYASIESRRDRVTRLYRSLLGRGPDAGGLAYWAEVLLVRDDVFLAEYLASSDEFFARAQR